jgi:hypothetical protein
VTDTQVQAGASRRNDAMGGPGQVTRQPTVGGSDLAALVGITHSLQGELATAESGDPGARRQPIPASGQRR